VFVFGIEKEAANASIPIFCTYPHIIHNMLIKRKAPAEAEAFPEKGNYV